MPASKKHHYIPAFYLKRWAGPDSRVCQFAKHEQKINAVRRHPNAIAFEYLLYSIEEIDDEIAHVVEDRFFKSIDNDASDALAILELPPKAQKWNPRTRSSWSRFLYSLLLRCPEDLIKIRETILISFLTTHMGIGSGDTKRHVNPTTQTTFAKYCFRNQNLWFRWSA